MATARSIITNALLEIGAYAQSETPDASDLTFGLSKLNRTLENLNAERLAIYDVQFTTFTLTPSHNPHTIGLAADSPDFVVTTTRPTRIEQANLILNDVTPNIYKPLNLRDDDWWMRLRVPTLTSNIPTDLLYHKDWPKGLIHLWPVPLIAYGLQLKTWTPIAQLATLDTAFSMPPGYEDMVTLTLAESLVGPFGVGLSPKLIMDAANSRARIKSLNAFTPEAQCDMALVSQSGGYNWYIGE